MKLTCSVRLDFQLKGDLDKLSEFNGQSLGHMVQNEMSYMLYELVRDKEQGIRNVQRNLRNIKVLEDWLVEKAGDFDLLLQDKPDDPEFSISEEEWYNLDNKVDRERLFACNSIYSYRKPPMTFWKLQSIKSSEVKDYKEIEEFLALADTFEWTFPKHSREWLDSEGKITKEARARIKKARRYNKEPLQERLEKIGRRYGFANYMDMWNGKAPATGRFLTRLSDEGC